MTVVTIIIAVVVIIVMIGIIITIGASIFERDIFIDSDGRTSIKKRHWRRMWLLRRVLL